MAMFTEVATEHLKVLFFIFVLGTGLHAVPANPDNACGSEFYLLVLTVHYFLVFDVFASAMLLLAVQVAISAAEAGAIAAARASGHKADHAAAVMGLAAVPAGWKRHSVRALLFITVHLSAAASYCAIVAFEDGFLYRTGYHGEYSVGSPSDYVLMYLMAVVHIFSGQVAMSCN